MARGKSKKALIFYLLGGGIIAFFLYQFDISVVGESFERVGAYLFVIFAWSIPSMFFNILCISQVIGHRVPFLRLITIFSVGEGYNALTPFGGLGGEPYKTKMISRYIPLEEASHSVIHDRMIHMLSGLLFTALTCLLGVALLDLSGTYTIALLLSGTVTLFFALAISWVALSRLPGQFNRFILQKLKLVEEYSAHPLSTRDFLLGLTFKLSARATGIIETYLLFIALGIDPTFGDLVLVLAMIALSATLVFFPQGLGINEAGISLAFQLIGQPIEAGLAFGLMRRARVVFWTVIFIALHPLTILWDRFFAKRTALS